VTRRTFVNQLELQGGSLQAYTDDEGESYTRSTMGGGVGLSFDHQTVATGRPVAKGGLYPKPVNYPNYVYYCTNDLYAADCAVSVDGGRNFLVSTPVYAGELAGGPCSAIFGHVKTDPRDGTVYLPPNGCKGKQMLFASHDNTVNWTGYTVPDSTDGDSGHPAIDVGRQDGRVYYAWGSADQRKGTDFSTGRTHVAVSPDHGKTWLHQTALGKDLGVVTSRFPVVVAGDAGRAAVAFLGAKVPGDPSAAPDPSDPTVKEYKGVWDLYVSYTADAGKTWRTYDATPTDPVQRGPICTRGTTCLAGRNLLDFNDITLDRSGHVLVALADGALTAKDDYTKGLAKATVVRQVGGPSLYAPPKALAPRRPRPSSGSTAGRSGGSGGSGGSGTGSGSGATGGEGAGTVGRSAASRSLASTGPPALLAAVGGGLLLGGLVLVRRRRPV